MTASATERVQSNRAARTIIRARPRSTTGRVADGRVADGICEQTSGWLTDPVGDAWADYSTAQRGPVNPPYRTGCRPHSARPRPLLTLPGANPYNQSTRHNPATLLPTLNTIPHRTIPHRTAQRSHTPYGRRQHPQFLPQLLRGTGTPDYALRLPHPRRRPHPPLHLRRHGSLQTLLYGRANATPPPPHQLPKILPHHRHRRSRRPQTPHLLRNAGQLQHRRLLQTRRHDLRLATLHRPIRPPPPHECM